MAVIERPFLGSGEASRVDATKGRRCRDKHQALVFAG